MKKRKIGPSKVKRIYGFKSILLGDNFLVESGLEYDACFIFEYDSSIKLNLAQPDRFKYQEYGRVGIYGGDFLVVYYSENKTRSLK